MPTRCMCFSTAWFHCTTAFLWMVVLPAVWSNQSTPRWDNSFTFAEASFVTIPVVWLTLHDQKSGCLMFYQRQLGGCLCMCLPNCVCVCVRSVQVKSSLFVSECLFGCERRKQRPLWWPALLMCWWRLKGSMWLVESSSSIKAWAVGRSEGGLWEERTDTKYKDMCK